LLKDDNEVTIVEISPASGDFEMTGDLDIRGNLFIDGEMSAPEFSAAVITTD
jgi:hypothetical protein